MMRRYVLSARARADLKSVGDYLERHATLRVAQRYVRDFDAAFANLLVMPYFGQPRADVGDARLRFVKVLPYVIAYMIEGDEVFVVRVVHGSRNFGKLFPP